MKQQALQHFDMPWLPVSALILFVICFIIYFWWTYRSQNKNFFQQMAEIPLVDEVKHKRNLYE
ncbi:MAG: cbb3-type cytochrome c oxidase subunit 3 [Bacteriovoracaceae bacterium]|nr:cbb3-type cytochrome c oxidase subunit 3 [Bacteriovoracaceae bacterium]